jgi:hypothetical protein
MNLNVLCFRKRCQVTPHYEASMTEVKVKPEENNNSNQSDKQHTNIDNKEPCEEDLEAIWKVMSTSHE